MFTRRFGTVYELSATDKARIRRAARRYEPVMSFMAADVLLMLEEDMVREGDMLPFELRGLRLAIEQFASLVGHHFHSAENASPIRRLRRKRRPSRPGGFTAEDLLSDVPAVIPSAEARQVLAAARISWNLAGQKTVGTEIAVEHYAVLPADVRDGVLASRID